MSDPSEVDQHPLSPIFEPRSVAVVGASTDPKKRGYQVLRALTASCFSGPVYPVNPKGGTIAGFAAYASIADLPEVPDLALICTPAHTVPDAVEACGLKGVRGAVVLAVGFGESGDEGVELERRLLEVARAGGVRLVGPNTSGILNLPLGLNLIGARGVSPGSLSLLVQSGNMALALMNEVTARSDEGIAICVGVGNELDLGFHDYLDYLGQHEGTRAIVAYVEGFKNARAFIETAARVARSKPVLVIKGARSDAGQAAARSHTGAVSGSYDRLSAALRQADVVEVRRTDELLHLAETLASQPPVEGGAGIAILSDGGGQGTLGADALSDMGVPMAVLAEDTRIRLRELLGRAAAVSNPVDLAGAADADPAMFGRALEVIASDAGVGGVLVVGLFGGYGIRFASELTDGEMVAAAAMSACMRHAGKPLVVHTMYATHRSEPLRALSREGVPVVESLDVACRCIGATWERGAMLARPAWQSSDVALRGPRRTWTDAAAAVAAVARARSEGRETLTEPEAQALLSEAGMPFPVSTLCDSAAAAAAEVERVGGAFALKVVSAKIPHKSDAGGVILGVETPAQAATAFQEIEARTSRYLEAAGLPVGIDGIMITPMLATPLAELLVGAHRDPGLGPMLTLGAGGIWVEVLADVAHRVLPVAPSEIEAMLGELKIRALLSGARGRARADLAPIVEAVSAVARCILEHAEVEEVEVNPLFVYPNEVRAVDARVFLGGYRRMVRGLAVAAVVAAGAACADGASSSDPRLPNLQPTAVSAAGMVVTGSPYATAAGSQILAGGGNAIDAAVAAAFALAVAEPTQSGLGGRTQMLVRLADGRAFGIDGSTEVPARYDPATAPQGEHGHAAIGIPGTVAALTKALGEHGTMELDAVLAPARGWARNGLHLPAGEARRLAGVAADLDPASAIARALLDVDGSAPSPDELFAQPDLARTLDLIASGGAEAFYRGPIARAIAEDMVDNGGYVTLEDLDAYVALETPVGRGTYRGFEVVGTYLPASGVTVIEALAILDRIAPPRDAAEWAAVVTGALVASFEDRELAEPLDLAVAVAWLTSDSVADRRASEVAADVARRTATGSRGASDGAAEEGSGGLPHERPEFAFTTHVSVADTFGNVVALTQSLGPTAGARVVTPGLGFIYASTLGGYLTGGGPGYRPWSSQAPVIVLSDGNPRWVMGGAGARRIVSALVAVTTRLVDQRMTLEEALGAPRVHATGGRVLVEGDWPAAAALTRMGYEVDSETPDYFARINVIEILGGEFRGVGEPRWRGSAASGPSRDTLREKGR